MWIVLALLSALCLGLYDVFKKLSVRGNDVLMVLLLNTVFGALFMLPFIVTAVVSGDFGLGNSWTGHIRIIGKSVIVLGSWLFGYIAIKHLPLTVQGPINASRPVIVLFGAMVLYGEWLNLLQWAGVALGFLSLLFISRIGIKESRGHDGSRWIFMSIMAMILGAASGLYDKYLLRLYSPLDVQSWYALYQCLIMVAALSLIRRRNVSADAFRWRWSIPCIALFLTAADMAYFHALSMPGAMIGIVSMMRRGSVIVSFLYGIIALKEKNIRPKLIDLGLLMLSLALLVLGSR